MNRKKAKKNKAGDELLEELETAQRICVGFQFLARLYPLQLCLAGCAKELDGTGGGL